MAGQPNEMVGPSAAPAPAACEDEDDVETEVRTVLRSCIHSVAMRHFVESHQPLFAELEQIERRLWAHEEVRHSMRLKQAQSRSAGRSRQRSHDAARGDGGGAEHGANGASGRQRRRLVQKVMDQSDDAEQRLSALHRRMQDIATGSVAASTSKLGGLSIGSGSVPTRQRATKCKGATPSASGHTPSPFASHAESLLPAAPARSQCAPCSGRTALRPASVLRLCCCARGRPDLA